MNDTAPAAAEGAGTFLKGGRVIEHWADDGDGPVLSVKHGLTGPCNRCSPWALMRLLHAELAARPAPAAAPREEGPDGKLHEAHCRMLNDWPHAPSGGPCSCAAAPRAGDVVASVLRELEWRHWSTRDGDERMCLICERDESRGHAPECRMAAAIEAARGEGTPMASETHQDANLTAMPARVASVPTVDGAAVLRDHVYDEAAPPSRNARVIGMPICESCGQPWRGDAETGGCDLVLLARRVMELEAALAKWDRWADPPFVPGAAWPVGEE